MIKYRENMNHQELSELLKEVDVLDLAYTSAYKCDAEHYQPCPEEWEDEIATLHRAALSQGKP